MGKSIFKIKQQANEQTCFILILNQYFNCAFVCFTFLTLLAIIKAS
jgi:hypothetical protein